MKQLYNFYWLKLEAEQLQSLINEYNNKFNISSSGTQTQVAKPLLKQLQAYQEKIAAEVQTMQSRIDNITDAEIKELAIMLFVERKGYQDIADRHYMDKTTVYKKLKRYFDKQ